MGRLGMKTALLAFLALAVSASAQSLVMKDGKIIPTKGIRRDGDTVIATVAIPGGEAGQPAKTGEFGYPIAQVARLDFPEPTQLRTAPELVAQGKAADAIAQLEPVVKYYENFREVAGSWWADAALLKAQALVSLGRDKEAEPLAEQIIKTATDPELVRAAEVQLAAGLVRKGSHERALETAERALKESKRHGTLALASIIKGECLLAKKEWDDAMLAFLRTPVFYPGEKILLPQAMLGAGRAQFGTEDFPRAKATLNELLKTYATAPEAALAQAELDKITRRETALAPPK
jgi:tetratricopeptide (TPR) repeat protein